MPGIDVDQRGATGQNGTSRSASGWERSIKHPQVRGRSGAVDQPEPKTRCAPAARQPKNSQTFQAGLVIRSILLGNPGVQPQRGAQFIARGVSPWRHWMKSWFVHSSPNGAKVGLSPLWGSTSTIAVVIRVLSRGFRPWLLTDRPFGAKKLRNPHPAPHRGERDPIPGYPPYPTATTDARRVFAQPVGRGTGNQIPGARLAPEPIPAAAPAQAVRRPPGQPACHGPARRAH